MAFELHSHAATFKTLASVTSLIPVTSTGPLAFKVDTPVFHEVSSNFGDAFSAMAEAESVLGELAGFQAQYFRMEDDWKVQKNISGSEVKQLEAQIQGAKYQIEVARLEIQSTEKEIKQNETMNTFMKSKFSNEQLYQWMTSKLSGLFFQTYKLGHDMAKSAEKAFQFELGMKETDFSFIGGMYWDSLRKGLLSGDALGYDLDRMEKAYMESNSRTFEIGKNISLADKEIQRVHRGENLLLQAKSKISTETYNEGVERRKIREDEAADRKNMEDQYRREHIYRKGDAVTELYPKAEQIESLNKQSLARRTAKGDVGHPRLQFHKIRVTGTFRLPVHEGLEQHREDAQGIKYVREGSEEIEKGVYKRDIDTDEKAGQTRGGWFGSQEQKPDYGRRAVAMNELASNIGVGDMIPETIRVTKTEGNDKEDEKGYVQKWVANGVPYSVQKAGGMEKPRIKLAIVDYIAGNPDRNNTNVLVVRDEQGEKQLYGIDNDLGFPGEHGQREEVPTEWRMFTQGKEQITQFRINALEPKKECAQLNEAQKIDHSNGSRNFSPLIS
ncbi:MAG: hypothetical protein AB4368_06080 [Xenococcaceae cyanobacterium]